MGKDNRTIHRTVRLDTRRIKDEDELAAALTPEQGKILLENGTLSGDWKFTGGSEAPSVEPAPESENSSLQKLLLDGEAEAEVRSKELSDAKTKLSEAQKVIEKGTQENTTLRTQIADAKGELTKTKGALSASEKRANELKIELDKVKIELESLKKAALSANPQA